MTRFASFLAACIVVATSVLGGIGIAACGRHQAAPAEMPPPAPPPTPTGADSIDRDPLIVDAGSLTPRAVRELPSPSFAPVTSNPPSDANLSDGYSPPLPPLPDATILPDGGALPAARD
jgi:hypothetical protein